MLNEKKEIIDIAMPEIYPGMKSAKITFWIFEEDEVDIIEPDDQLLRVETEHAYYNIPNAALDHHSVPRERDL